MELTLEVNLPTNLGELTFRNMSKWVIDHSVVGGSARSAASPWRTLVHGEAPVYRGT